MPGAQDWGHLMEARSVETCLCGATVEMELLRRQKKTGKNTLTSPRPPPAPSVPLVLPVPPIG